MNDRKESVDLEQESRNLLSLIEKSRDEIETYYPKILEQETRDALEQEVEETVASLRRATVNMTKAAHQTFQLADELDSRYDDLERTEKKRILPPAPANSMIDRQEEVSCHFAKGLGTYKLLWICFIGSFAGVVVELLWCLFRYGYLESRSGLIYGPFNLLYGVGAVALTLALYRFRNRGPWLSFLGGFLVGSALEYLCSWGQELLLGSRSWDYSMMPFNLNGRICLLYSVFWGILGVLWIKDLYPRMAKAILKLPNKAGRIATWIFALFFAVNVLISGISVYRWSERVQDIEANSAFWEVIDERFPNERMERIFANMEFNQQ